MKRDNISIVFNNNTYNLNVVDHWRRENALKKNSIFLPKKMIFFHLLLSLTNLYFKMIL